MSITTELALEGSEFLCRRREKTSLSQEFEQHALPELSRVYSAALCMTRAKADAEDLVQETFARAYRYFDKFQRGTNCRAWLLSIMRNLFCNDYRREKSQPQHVEWNTISEACESQVDQWEKFQQFNPASRLVSESMDDVVHRALADLPDEFRMAVVLVDVEELTYEEAGTAMKVPVGTVRSRVSRGRRLLRAELRDYALARGYTED